MFTNIQNKQTNKQTNFQPPELDNLARKLDNSPRPQPPDDNLNFPCTTSPTNLFLFAFLPQNMPGDKNVEPEINIASNWHAIPTFGDLLANDTNYLAHFLSLHPFDNWPPKQPPRPKLEVTFFFMAFSVTQTGCELIFVNNVPMLSSAILYDSSGLTAICPDFALQPLYASSYLYSTHFSLICTLYAVPMLPSASFSDGSLATVLSLGFAGHTLSAFSSLYSICFSLIYELDTVPRLSSASFFDDSLVTVISPGCAGQSSSHTMRLDSGCAFDNARCLSPCSLAGVNVFSVSFVPVPRISPAYNTDDQLDLLHCTVCLSILKQILAHQNFSRVCTTYLLRHFCASPGRLRLLMQSSRGRKRLHTLNLELIQRHSGIETRTCLHTQPLSSGPPGYNIRSSHLHPSQTQSSPSQQVSPPTSALGKRPSLVFRNADSNKKKQKTQSSPSSPSTRPLHSLTLNIRGMTPEK